MVFVAVDAVVVVYSAPSVATLPVVVLVPAVSRPASLYFYIL